MPYTRWCSLWTLDKTILCEYSNGIFVAVFSCGVFLSFYSRELSGKFVKLVQFVFYIAELLALNFCQTWYRQHDLFKIITAARGCTVSLGCSRRLDHQVIKMDRWPSFSQPNVRENQLLKLIAAYFIAIRSQTSLSQIVGRIPTEEDNLWGKFLSFLNPVNPVFRTITPLAIWILHLSWVLVIHSTLV